MAHRTKQRRCRHDLQSRQRGNLHLYLIQRKDKTLGAWPQSFRIAASARDGPVRANRVDFALGHHTVSIGIKLLGHQRHRHHQHHRQGAESKALQV